MSFECPLCSTVLNTKSKSTKIEFFCQECGYNKIGPAGYSKKKAYEFITKKRSKQSDNSSGFPTKSKRRKKRNKELDQESEKLEKDRLIQENAEEIFNRIDKENIPKPLVKTLHDQSHEPVYHKKLPKTQPPLGENVEDTVPISGIRKRLQEKGIDRLYQYQEEVQDEILNGNNVVISAPTGLGKTEAFLLPILHIILKNNPDPRFREGPQALLIYPTKALAADQRDKIKYYCNDVGIRVAVYDGDTPQNKRQKIYSHPPDILITNADMIHYHLMGNSRFKIMVKRVKFIVLDEIHLCVGSFGSNVLWIIRRLRRFAPNLQCIGASATVSNAKHFAETIFDTPVKLISVGTARKSDMYMTMLYPKERSNLSTMAEVTQNFVTEGHRTLVFGNGHLSAEAVNLMLNQRGLKSEVHRAGLSKSHRSKVENKFKSGELDALVSTPTLELGIDIGSLDSVVSMLTGITSFVQRIGRAGRKGQDSFATLVLRGDDPISAYYARNPDEYFTDLDPAFVEPENKHVARYQLLSMILDKPLKSKEAAKYKPYIDKLLEEGLIRRTKGKYVPENPKKVRKELTNYSIRGIGQSVDIWYLNNKIGDRSLPMALSELHPGAIYLHGGNSYKVQNYNEKLQTAKVSKIGSRGERTQAMRNIKPRIENIHEEIEVDGLETAYCELELTETVHGYIKKNIFSDKIIGKYDLDNPISYEFKTKGFLLSLPKPDDFVSHLSHEEKQNVLGGTFHAIEHVLIESGNSFSGGGANQIGGISLGDTGLVFVYDGTEGGSGLSKLLYDSLSDGVERSLKIMENCPCKRRDGCPRCTYSYYCGNNNQPLDRKGAIEALQRFGKDSTELIYNFEGIETFVVEPEFIIPRDYD